MDKMVRKNFYLTEQQQEFFESLDGNVSEHLRRAADDYIEKKKGEKLNANMSPIIVKKIEIKTPTMELATNLTFPEAMQAVIDGKKITRIDWDDKNTYGVLEDGLLMIYIKGEIHKWLVSDGDMFATDWIILSSDSN